MSYPDNEKLALGRWASSKYATLGVRKGITWVLSSDRITPQLTGERGRPPATETDPNWAKRIAPDEILISGYDNHTVSICDEEHNVLWQFGEFMVSGSDDQHLDSPRKVDYRDGKVLIADNLNNRVLEVDRETKEVVNKLTGTDAGGFGRPYDARYNPDTGNIMVADWVNHFVCETDWQGNIAWSFGTHGTEGSGTNLSRPRHVDLAGRSIGNLNYVTIADTGNHRGIFYDKKNDTIEAEFMIPHCLFFKVGRNGRPILASRDQSGIYGAHGTVFYPAHTWFMNRYRNTTRYMVKSNYEIVEIDVTTLHNLKQTPKSVNCFDSVSLDANESTIIHPFHTIGHDQANIHAYSTESATLNIYKIQPYKGPVTLGVRHPLALKDWREYDSVSLSADTLESYLLSSPSGGYGVEIVMGGTAGTADCWVDLGGA